MGLTLEVKLIILAVFAAILVCVVGGAGWTAYHYHNAWVEAEKQLAIQSVNMANLTSAADQCSAGTTQLQTAADKKAVEVKAAQAQAASLAKNNEMLAQSLLNAKPTVVDNSCKSAVELFKKYKQESDPLVKNEGIK
jgi:hypothetical protein